jgi:hypothetical protein
VPKEVFKIEGFHGGLNSNSDPRDIREIESPSIQDVAIDSVGKIKTLGSFDNGNVFHSGITASTLASTQITLASSASGSDDFYNGYSIFITTGQGIGQERKITDYTGSSKSCAISPAWDSPAPTSGSGYEIRGDGNEISILKNRGLFTMSSDRQLDGGSANETLIFLHDNANHTIDVNDSEGWDTALINMGGSSIPIYYTADGVIRVSDASLTQNSQWFGYISDVRFSSLNAVGPSAAWINAEQSLTSPTSGKCLISNPEVGSDTNGINSSASEYIGNVIQNGTDADDVVEHSAVNLRVGIQYDELLNNTASGWDYDVGGATLSDVSSNPLKLLGDNNVKFTSNGNGTISKGGDQSLDFSLGNNRCFIFGFHIKKSEYDNLGQVLVTNRITSVLTSSITWKFSVNNLKPDCWNILVCSSDNINTIASGGSIDQSNDAWIVFAQQNGTTGTGSNASPTWQMSGPVIAENQGLEAFQPGLYTFHYSYLYDVENKQESLPFTFNDVDEDGTLTDRENVNKINIVGGPVLFNFDTYICSNVSAGDAYGLNKRISGSRLYWKVEENDNYFLIGELDFVEKGFKFIPEADTLSYTMSNTSNTTGNILGKTALIKGISPDSANTVDTFKTINGFSTEVKSLDAKYKTAVVHGRRVYIGNIKRPDGKTHPDRIIKSQVNRFDTFPEGMGSVDVVIRDGENIVKLEAYADRILQFKEHSLYIINVSESVDFLEDTFRNKGCAFDYHVVRTDLGIAWFNDHGCYLYDGKSVIHLLEKQGIRLINEDDWSLFVKDGTDDTDMSSAMIGYIPKKKHLIIKNENNDIYLYDFVLQSWTIGSGKVTESTAMTNFALNGDQNLFYIDNTTTIRKTWQSSSQSTTSLIFKSKDIDFGQSSIRKKIYRVRINYKGDAEDLVVKYSVNGDTDSPYDFEGTDASTGKPTGSTASSSKPLHDKTDLTQWYQAELKPDVSSEANNIYSFQLHMSGTVDSDFEINDISIIYRLKNVK